MFLTQSYIPLVALRQDQVWIIAEINSCISIIINDKQLLIQAAKKVLRKMWLPPTPSRTSRLDHFSMAGSLAVKDGTAAHDLI